MPDSHASGSLTPRERMIRAATRKPVDGPPLWIMRQAGRYLPEYHDVRRLGTFMETCHDPERAAEITCQPIRRFGMDAAVIFSDILVPAEAMGLDVSFEEGKGPRVTPPVRDRAAVDRLHPFDPEEETGFLGDAIRLVRKELGPDRAIIGFCGAPFTTASYMIEGQSSRNFEHTKAMLHGDPATWRELVEKIVDALIPYLGMQIEAGADVVQIFDSWGGSLARSTYEDALREPMERLIGTVKSLGKPVILYVNGGGHLLELLADLGPDVVGIDWRVEPEDARRRIGGRVALQGNLDPSILFAPPEVVRTLTNRNLDAFGPAPGHVFNLGSGILPETPILCVEALVEAVKARRETA
jgi:uroporphyrinogen decarboxylase